MATHELHDIITYPATRKLIDVPVLEEASDDGDDGGSREMTSPMTAL
jgi:hypothetical protein